MGLNSSFLTCFQEIVLPLPNPRTTLSCKVLRKISHLWRVARNKAEEVEKSTHAKVFGFYSRGTREPRKFPSESARSSLLFKRITLAKVWEARTGGRETD